MPQMFQVLKCYKCSVFQVHLTKKSNKWECKLCGEKQSIKRHYGLGTGKECRLHVQKLNGIRGEINEQTISAELNKSSDEELENNNPNIKQETSVRRKTNSKSKWSNYIDETELPQRPDQHDSMYFGNTEVVLEVPLRKRKKFKPPTSTFESTSNLPSYGPNEAYNVETYEPMYNFESKDYVYSYEINKPICKQTTFKSSASDSYANNFFKTNTFKVHTTESNEQIASKNSISNELGNVMNEKAKEKSNLQDENHIRAYIPLKLNQNSKWAEFIDEPCETDLNMNREDSSTVCTNQDDFVENVFSAQDKAVENVPSQEEPNKIPPKANLSKNIYSDLFNICDESELENILDF